MGGQQQVHSVDHAHSFGTKQGHCPVDSCIFVHQLGSAPALLARTPAQGWRSRAEQLGPESTARFAAERVLCRPRLPGAHGARVVLARLLALGWARFAGTHSRSGLAQPRRAAGPGEHSSFCGRESPVQAAPARCARSARGTGTAAILLAPVFPQGGCRSTGRPSSPRRAARSRCHPESIGRPVGVCPRSQILVGVQLRLDCIWAQFANFPSWSS